MSDADKDLLAAKVVIRIADHHSAGMLSRCHHFETAEALAPMSDAIASLDGQISMIERNEPNSVMAPTIGQSVLDCKAIVSYDYSAQFADNLGVEKNPTRTNFKRLFIARIRAAREATGLTQTEMGERLGLGVGEDAQGHYKQFEGRSLLPHYLVGPFCSICKINPAELYHGLEKQRKTA